MIACRFSLARLFCVTAFVAIACAALAQPSPFWLTTIVSTTVAVLFYAVLAAIYRAGARGAYWRGMAIVGWGYFLLVFVALSSSSDEVPLVTTQLLEMLDEMRPPDDCVWEPALVPVSAIGPLTSGATGTFDFEIYTASSPPPANPPPPPGSLVPTMINPAAYDPTAFTVIGECLWALLLGCAGGLIAKRLHAARDAHSA